MTRISLWAKQTLIPYMNEVKDQEVRDHGEQKTCQPQG